MDAAKLPSPPLPPIAEGEVEARHPAHSGGDHRIQFAPTAKPDRRRLAHGDEDAITRRPQSVTSVRPVISEKVKHHRKSQEDQEKKNVDIDEHLMPHREVAERYASARST